MESNRYSPPLAPVADPVVAERAPPLWNPNAAANWSLLFTAAFGAYLHMRNWQALGETQRAARSRVWMWAVLGLLAAWVVMGVLLPESPLSRGGDRVIGFGLLVSWYFASAREQARYVKERFGDGYPRRGWGKPLLAALGCIAGFLLVLFVIGFGLAMAGRA